MFRRQRRNSPQRTRSDNVRRGVGGGVFVDVSLTTNLAPSASRSENADRGRACPGDTSDDELPIFLPSQMTLFARGLRNGVFELLGSSRAYMPYRPAARRCFRGACNSLSIDPIMPIEI